MCGILNVVNKNARELDLPSCRRALSCLTLRGPDLSTYEVWEGRVFLGQTILSITGDIHHAASHLDSISGRFHVGLNGEIYNYRALKSRWLDKRSSHGFLGDTDTEVLVNLHELLSCEEVPSLLDGMFAYTILDRKKRTLGICRDVQGEKTLYVYEDPELIVISSEISPIFFLVPSLEIDPQVLRDYFHTRHFMFLDRTLYPGMRQILPGHLETIDLSTMRWSKFCYDGIEKWISPATMEENSKRSLESLTDELDALMGNCVKEMIPERKHAAVVSGGVDSSLISYYVVKHGSPGVLISVNHKGKDRISQELSGFETVLGHKIDILPVDAFTYSSEIIRCQRICRAPLFVHSFVGQAVQSAFVRSLGCSVLFGGDGADELLGGYPCYLTDRLLNTSFSPSAYTTFYPAGVEFIRDDSRILQQELSQAWQRSLMAYQHIENPSERVAQAMMFCDFTWQLPSVCLRGADLMSLMWNIETRTVFVRRPIIEFALNLPLWAKSDNTLTTTPLLRAKPLLKKLFLRYFEPELLVEKQGFAGFPNEAAAYIGDIKDFLALDFLEIDFKKLEDREIDPGTHWKLVNIEYFLRFVASQGKEMMHGRLV